VGIIIGPLETGLKKSDMEAIGVRILDYILASKHELQCDTYRRENPKLLQGSRLRLRS
jgi:hypothetical protein